MSEKKLIGTRDELIKIIERTISRKHGAYITLWPLKFDMKWVGGHKVTVFAYQQRLGSNDYHTTLTVSMTKGLMRDFESKFRDVTKEFADFLYPSVKRRKR